MFIKLQTSGMHVTLIDVQMLQEQEETRSNFEKLLRDMNRESSDLIKRILEKEIDGLQSDSNVSSNYTC
jgi:predicted translin family RNA/ssDNA-binding protein